jgi:chorismate mutase/prephenate dehydratase
MIFDTIDFLTTEKYLTSGLSIKEQLELNIELYLLGNHALRLDKIEKVYSHEYPLKISETWIRANLSPKVKLCQLTSTSESAHRVKKEKTACAIASIEAAKNYKLKILGKIVRDGKMNITRFFVISQTDITQTKHDTAYKTSIIFSLKDRVGVLYDALKVFKKDNINLSRIVSRPHATKIWEYIFMVEIDGHVNESKIKKALTDFKKTCVEMHILGSYPTIKI